MISSDKLLSLAVSFLCVSAVQVWIIVFLEG